MNKISFLIWGWIIIISFSCRKTESPKDYEASIKNKTWWGELTYTGKTIEYYSVHFNADNSLIWSQLSGDYFGQWVINGKELTMTFTGNNAEIKADISDNDKLMNITDNTGSYEVNSGGLILNPDLPLENTVWLGSIYKIGTAHSQQLSFLPGFKVEIKVDNTAFGPYAYTRSASGAFIRIPLGGMYPFFGVVTSDMGMKGSDSSPDYPWQAIKQ